LECRPLLLRCCHAALCVLALLRTEACSDMAAAECSQLLM